MKKMICFILSVVFLSGCGNYKGIDNVAYVVGLGVDIDENDEFSVTFLTAVPQNGSKEKKAGTETFTHHASNIYLTSDIYESKFNKKIDLSHCRIIVFSEDVAKKGVSFFKKTLLNEKSFRPDTLSVISSSTAEEYLNSDIIKKQENPARYFEMMFDSKTSPHIPSFTIKDFYSKKEYVIPLIDENGIKGSIIMKNDVLLTDLSKRQTLVFKLLTGDFSHSYFNFDDDKTVLSLYQDKSPGIYVSNEKISITLYLSGELITEISSKDQSVYIDSLKNECENFINFTKKELNCDIFGICDRVRFKFSDNETFDAYDFYSKYPYYDFSVAIIYHPIKTYERNFGL